MSFETIDFSRTDNRHFGGARVVARFRFDDTRVVPLQKAIDL